jgi:hypothetical protein
MLPPTLADWAKEVRLIGNVGAHFDPLEDVESRDAEQLRDSIHKLLSYLYIPRVSWRTAEQRSLRVKNKQLAKMSQARLRAGG